MTTPTPTLGSVGYCRLAMLHATRDRGLAMEAAHLARASPAKSMDVFVEVIVAKLGGCFDTFTGHKPHSAHAWSSASRCGSSIRLACACCC